MIRPDVQTLYKYFAVTEESLTALRTGAFWFANPPTFNDPFDCAIRVDEGALEESLRDALATLRTGERLDPSTISLRVTPEDVEAYTTFREGMGRAFDDVGIFCLTEVPTSLLMWAHYADAHRGFCIGFARTPTDILGRYAQPVNYRFDYPRLSAAHFNPITHPNSADQIWLTKANSWQYEKEWRLMSDEGSRLHTLDARVTTIIFGLRMSPDHRRAVRKALAGYQPQPGYWETVMSTKHFEPELRPAED